MFEPLLPNYQVTNSYFSVVLVNNLGAHSDSETLGSEYLE